MGNFMEKFGGALGGSLVWGRIDSEGVWVGGVVGVSGWLHFCRLFGGMEFQSALCWNWGGEGLM